MQSIFRLPWCSDPIAPKMSEKAALEHARQSPVVDFSALNKLKRKHSLEPVSPPRTQPHKKQRPECAESLDLPSENARLPIKQEGNALVPSAESKSPVNIDAPSANATSNLANADLEYTRSIDVPLESTQVIAGAQQTGPSLVKDETSQPAQLQLPADSTDMSSLQEVIENEFNMQILVKHNELRLIEQELAKCQVALEQLRRCELRPYPGDERPLESVSAGTGPAIAPAHGFTRPAHASPYGVTDGPYSRHYSQWLLRDAQFDSTPLHSPIYAEGYSPVPARSTRTTASARKSVSKPFDFPGRPGGSLHSIPNYPAPAPKEKGAPQVLRRSTDGQLVKLICNNCHRGNFSSIQGFLNHCRIAHKVDYKSHDAAAIDCGQLLDENEAANLPAETQNAPVPKPSASKPSIGRAPTAQATPARSFSSTFVHPLNTTSGAPVSANHSRQNSTASRKPIHKIDSAVQSAATSPLTPSPYVPHLSAYFAKHQLGGDLAKAAAIAKQKVDLGADEDVASPSTEQNSPLDAVAPGSRMVTGGAGKKSELGGNGARPPSRKGFRQPAQMQRPRPSPLAPTPSTSMLKDDSMSFLSSPQDHTSISLSPHTADSNPGLVSDHEDDDHSDSGEDAPQDVLAQPPPLSVGARNCSDNMEIDVAVEDDVGRDGVVIRRNSLLMDDDPALRGGPGSPSRKLGGGRRV